MTHRLAVLLSGAGTNLQAILDAIATGDLPARVTLVLSNRAGAPGVARARRAGLPTAVIDHRDYPDREAFDRAMIGRIDAAGADTVVLAGFMRILSPLFVRHYRGRLINIHPSLLPKYPGLDTHARALAAGDARHGCSLHFVTDELDGGPLIARAEVAVEQNDNVETLSKRVQQQEHSLYPRVLRWRAEGRLHLTDQGVELDGETLPASGLSPGTPA
ncbi:phosphoribosylglycinamide formyltransferase [Alloalcanivorax sp. C16-2]|uniref:phosphoribosylglycinamide formyltransferase n=1 Tax=Alloalcanivorax sp. C16-2 TaxID=3390052 RepID=UPI003970ECF6